MSNPPDKPGFLVIAFLGETADQQLLQTFLASASVAGYTVADQNQNSVLLERGY